MGVRLDLPNVELVDQHTALIKELETRQRIFIRELPAKLSEDMTWGFAKANLAPASLILASSGWLCPEFMAGAGDVANAAGNDADDDDQVPMDVGLAGYDVVDEGEAKARAKLAEEYVATTLGRRGRKTWSCPRCWSSSSARTFTMTRSVASGFGPARRRT